MRVNRWLYFVLVCVAVTSLISIPAAAFSDPQQTPLPYLKQGVYGDVSPENQLGFGNYIRQRVSSTSFSRCIDIQTKDNYSCFEIVYTCEVLSSRVYGETQRIYMPYEAIRGNNYRVSVKELTYPYVVEVYVDSAAYNVPLSQTMTYPASEPINITKPLGVIEVNISYNPVGEDEPAEDYTVVAVVEISIYVDKKIETLPPPETVPVGGFDLLEVLAPATIVMPYITGSPIIGSLLLCGAGVLAICLIIKMVK